MFDPFGFACRFFPERVVYALVRCAGVLLFGALLAVRVSEYHGFFLKPLWFVETLIYVIFLYAWIVRRVPLDRSRGVEQIVLPLVVAAWPFLFLFFPPHPAVWQNETCLWGIFWWMTVMTTFTVWALWHLRTSFSITAEVRNLITDGPYRFVRYPMYFGEILTAAAVVAWRFTPLNAALYVAFVAMLLLRARVEERKLTAWYGDAYRAFAQSRWWFLPPA